MTRRKFNVACMVLAVVLVVALGSAVGLMAFAEDAATAQTRIYNENFDRMLDDGSGDGATPAYRAVSWAAGHCDDAEDPILKMASAKIAAGFDTLNIELRSSEVTLADLTLAFRISDGVPLKTYALNHADIVGGIQSDFEISAEWQTLSIDMASTEVGIVSTDPDAMVGFHLYATDATKAGSLDIRKVSVSSGANETVIWSASGVNETYWAATEGGCFVDHASTYEIADSKQIVSDDAAKNNLDGAYDALVLKIAGSGTVTVAPVGSDGTVGTAKAWADLTDLNGTALAALTEEYANTVISLSSLGLKEIKGVQVAVTGGSVKLAQAFFTNMEARDPDKYFPALDVDSIAYMSQFNFEYTNVGGDYVQATADCAPFGLNYVLNYNNNPSTITGGHLVLNANGQSHTQMKINSKVASEGRRYLVVKYKLEDGATLNDFRFNILPTAKGDIEDGSNPVYANQFKAGFGLASLSELNPYAGNKGYEYLVVDLLETFGTTDITGLDIYFSGAGQLLIDEIYYAHPKVNATTLSDNILTEDLELVVPDAGEADPAYAYLTGKDLDGKHHDGIEFVMRGATAETTLDEIRIEMGGQTLYFNGEHPLFYDIYGRTMPALSAENQTYSIDFAKSGIAGALTNMHVHSTSVAGGKTIIIESIKYVDYDFGTLKESGELLAAPIVATKDAADYLYIGGFAVPNLDSQKFAIMEMEVEGDIENLRLEMGGGTYWAKQNDLSLRDSDGQLFDATETGRRTLVIDLKQSGVTGDISYVHAHTNTKAAGETFTIHSVKVKGYTDVVASDDLLAEPLTGSGEGYQYVGYIPASGANIPASLALKVTGDLTNMRLGFEGTDKTLWFAENAEGSLYGLDGNLFDLTETDERTLVIDLAKSGLYYPLNGIHVHNNDNAVTISSAIYRSRPIGYEGVVLPTNDDTKPVITADVPTSGTVGTEIALTATATDNYSDEVTISYAVALGTTPVTVTNNKFTPAEAGTYAVTITATDKAGNVATQTVSITVAAAAGEPTQPTEPTGLSAGAIVGIVLACLAVVAVVVVVVVLKKKKASN